MTFLLYEKAKKENYKSSIDWLIQAGLLLKCIKIKKPEIPIKAYEDKNYFKLYLGDVGLLVNLAKYDFFSITHNKGTEFKGVLAENYIAQVFASKGYNLNYWTQNQTSEVDFILQLENKIIPIEVKSSENTKSRSLTTYINKYNAEFGIRISTKNFGFDNKIKSIPLYGAHLI